MLSLTLGHRLPALLKLLMIWKLTVLAVAASRTGDLASVMADVGNHHEDPAGVTRSAKSSNT